jgi:hypothetical protein
MIHNGVKPHNMKPMISSMVDLPHPSGKAARAAQEMIETSTYIDQNIEIEEYNLTNNHFL